LEYFLHQKNYWPADRTHVGASREDKPVQTNEHDVEVFVGGWQPTTMRRCQTRLGSASRVVLLLHRTPKENPESHGRQRRTLGENPGRHMAGDVGRAAKREISASLMLKRPRRLGSGLDQPGTTHSRRFSALGPPGDFAPPLSRAAFPAAGAAR
jgi:hypothetical protein